MKSSEAYLGFAAPFLFGFAIIWGGIALTSGPGHEGAYLAAVCFGISLLAFGLPLIRRVTLSAEGIRVRSPWTGITFVPWKDVSAVSCRRWATATIRIRAGQRLMIVVPWYLTGMRQLQGELEARVSRGVSQDAFTRYRNFLAAP
jgi:hypothetical protein